MVASATLVIVVCRRRHVRRRLRLGVDDGRHEAVALPGNVHDVPVWLLRIAECLAKRRDMDPHAARGHDQASPDALRQFSLADYLARMLDQHEQDVECAAPKDETNTIPLDPTCDGMDAERSEGNGAPRRTLHGRNLRLADAATHSNEAEWGAPRWRCYPPSVPLAGSCSCLLLAPARHQRAFEEAGSCNRASEAGRPARAGKQQTRVCSDPSVKRRPLRETVAVADRLVGSLMLQLPIVRRNGPSPSCSDRRRSAREIELLHESA